MIRIHINEGNMDGCTEGMDPTMVRVRDRGI
jgi:hypothetical protein